MRRFKDIKWKLNLFDIVIIVVALAAAFGVYKLLNADRGGGAILSSGKSTVVRYTLELTNMIPETADAISVGDNVIEVVEKHAIGKVVSFEVGDYYLASSDLTTGDTIYTKSPGRISVNFLIEVTASETDSALIIDGMPLLVGSNLSVTGPGWSGVGVITGIVREAKNEG
ncbi:MAG: DUF4330 domain-containing protein [Oscillospiraceae bacterium]|jgi:hypothetical protein|nr:DUF4330 domain-containing protein [Oscillospiraceae bacterium]